MELEITNLLGGGKIETSKEITRYGIPWIKNFGWYNTKSNNFINITGSTTYSIDLLFMLLVSAF